LAECCREGGCGARCRSFFDWSCGCCVWRYIFSIGVLVIVHGVMVSPIGAVSESWAGKVHSGRSVHVVVGLPHQFQFTCPEGSAANKRRARWMGVVEERILARS